MFQPVLLVFMYCRKYAGNIDVRLFGAVIPIAPGDMVFFFVSFWSCGVTYANTYLVFAAASCIRKKALSNIFIADKLLQLSSDVSIQAK
ncbi:hypothetical protein ACTHGU_11915 [Chitinophagaceae bacterium MMS25-I14]